MSAECLITRKRTLKILCKSKHFPRRYNRKREWVFFSEHSVHKAIKRQGVSEKKLDKVYAPQFCNRIRHRVMRFSAKCSERNSLHEKDQCLNTAIVRFPE